MTYYKKGDWNAICDRCGGVFKASELKKEWDGLMVCKRDWEPRHPQERVKAKKDDQSVPWSRPEKEPIFQNTYPYFPEP